MARRLTTARLHLVPDIERKPARGARRRSDAAALRALLTRFRTEAAQWVGEGGAARGLDPAQSVRRGEAALEQLARIADDGTPEVLLAGDDPLVYWQDVLEHLLADLQRCRARPDARIHVRPPDPSLLRAALATVREERRRLLDVINGTGEDRQAAAALRDRVLGPRAAPRGQVAAICDLQFQIAGIQGLGNATPRALRRMVPRLLAALEAVKNAPVVVGRPRAPSSTWSVPVLVATRALDAGLAAFVSWAAATATPQRIVRIRRAVGLRARPKTERPRRKR